MHQGVNRQLFVSPSRSADNDVKSDLSGVRYGVCGTRAVSLWRSRVHNRLACDSADRCAVSAALAVVHVSLLGSCASTSGIHGSSMGSGTCTLESTVLAAKVHYSCTAEGQPAFTTSSHGRLCMYSHPRKSYGSSSAASRATLTLLHTQGAISNT